MAEKVNNTQEVKVKVTNSKKEEKTFYTCKDDRAFKEFFMNEKK